MPFCEHCGNEIGYLPFNCNYCGGTFCKQHRLPENHECSFELKHKPAVPTTSRKMRQSQQELPRPISQDYLYKGPRQLKKYLKRQEKERRRTRRVAQQRIRSPISPGKLGNGTLFIIIMIVLFSALEIGRQAIELDSSVLQLNDLGLPAIYIWRIFTSPFVYAQDIFSFFFLFIIIYFLRFMGQLIEVQYGTSYLLKFYFLCVGVKMLFHALLNLPFALLYPNNLNFLFIPIASAPAAIFGLIALLLLPMMNRQITGLMGFFPVRTKGSTFLWIMILFILLPGLLSFLLYGDYITLIFSIPDLGGLLVAYLVVFQKIKLRR